MVSLYKKKVPSLQVLQLSSSSSLCPNHNYIQLLDVKNQAHAQAQAQAQKKKEISEKDLEKKRSLQRPTAIRWEDQPPRDLQNYVKVNEFYSAMEEQEEIVKKIKQIFQNDSTSPSLSLSQFLQACGDVIHTVTSEEAMERVIQYCNECRVENKPMKNIVGVVFKTEKEVIQFCSLLKEEGINYRSIEPNESVRTRDTGDE